jgi:endoglucanase
MIRISRALRPIACALALLLAAAGGAPAAEGFVRVDGQRFVAPGGETFAIKSINLGNWLMPEGYMFRFERARSPREIAAFVERLVGREEAARFWQTFRETYVTEEDVRFIRAAGFTTVRVPLHYGLFVKNDDPAGFRADPSAFVDDPSYFQGPGYRLVDRLIGWCRDAGLKVIIDLHAAPGGQTGVNHDDGPGYPMMFYVPSLRRQTVALWRHLAARYRDEPTVLGYDLLNEPISPYHDMDYLNPRLEPMYREILEAIRSVDDNHIVFLAGAQWSTSFSMLGPPFADNVAYTYHKFWTSTERDGVQEYVNFSNRYDVPVFVGETGELTDEWNDGFRRLNERFGFGWSFWPYKYMDSTSTVVSVPRPPGWDRIAAAARLAPGTWTDADLPPREEASQILAAYLEAIRLENGRVNRGYLASLGLGGVADARNASDGPEARPRP